MKTNLLRLGSVVKNGVGGVGTAAINLIYSSLLQKYGINFYSYIFINQIGDDLKEFVMKEGEKVYINIRYPAYEDYQLKTVYEKDTIRLDIIHNALLKLAQNDKRIEIQKLNSIKEEIIEKDFSFEIEYKKWYNKKVEGLIACTTIYPKENYFDIYVSITKGAKQICKLLIYKGKPTDYYLDDLFFYGKWKNLNEFLITGKSKEMEFHITIDKCSINYVNLSRYDQGPFYQMMRAEISEHERTKAYEDYIHSLPPGIAAIITHQPN